MQTFNYKDEVEEAVDNIFGALLGGDDTVQKAKYREVFESKLSMNVFSDEHAILYSLIIQDRISSINDITGLMNASVERIMLSENIVRNRILQGLSVTDEEFIEILTDNVIKLYKHYREAKVSEKEFLESLDLYKTWYLQKYYLYINETCQEITVKGKRIPNKYGKLQHVCGWQASNQFYADKIREIEKISKGERSSSVVIDEEWLPVFHTLFGEDDRIIDFGISSIDKCFALRGGHMLGIAGPPKGGKTRCSAFLVARALMQGKNVCVWPLEGSYREWVAMVVASMLAQDEGLSRKLDHLITSSQILDGSISRNGKAGYVDRLSIAFSRLATGKDGDRKIGRLSFIQQTAYAEDFLTVIDTHYHEQNQFDIIVIDQLVNILSKSGAYSGKSERISDSYMRMKDYVANTLKNVLAVIPCQLKQESIKRLRDKPDEDLDVTSGGESAETIRTPDYVLGIYADSAMRKNKTCKFYCVATRHSASFDTFDAHAEYGACYFCDDNTTSKIQARI